MQFSEVVNRVHELATVINDYWRRELPKRHPNYPLVEPGVDDPPPPPQVKELQQFLLSRPAEEVYKIRAIVDVGSGRPATDFNTRWQRLMKDDPDTHWQIAFLTVDYGLDEALTEGLEKLSAQHIDLDAGQPVSV